MEVSCAMTNRTAFAGRVKANKARWKNPVRA